jgi:hypothetical protein
MFTDVLENCTASIFGVDPEDDGSMLLKKVGKHLPNCMVSIHKTVSFIITAMENSNL